MRNAPVTVVIPVYNRFELLRETLASIASQTVSPSEIILVDDGSTDGTRDALATLDDPRIRVILNQDNLGAGETRNRGIEAATEEFVCLTDQDDLWLPTKLEKQFARMGSPDAPVLVGTRAETFSATGDASVEFSHYSEDECLREYFFYSSPFVSSSVMVRRVALVEHELRFRSDMGKSSCEDYDLWWRLSMVGKIANIPEVLLRYREHATQQSRLREDEMIKYSDVVRDQVLADRNIRLTESQRLTLTRLGRYSPISAAEISEIKSLFGAFMDQRNANVPRQALRVHAEIAFQSIARSEMGLGSKVAGVLALGDNRVGGIGFLLNQLKRLVS